MAAADYSLLLQSELFGMVKIKSNQAVNLRLIVKLDADANGLTSVTLTDGSVIQSDLPLNEIYKSFNNKVVATHQAQSGVKPDKVTIET